MNMEQNYNFGTKNRHENHQEQVGIRLSEIFSISSLESKRLTDYLQSFSQTSVDIKDSLNCMYHLKEKKHKLYRHTKPYSRNKQEGKLFHSISSVQQLTHPQSLEHKDKLEKKNTANTKSLKVTNPNGTTTEVTLEPVVLMHVRELPASGEPNVTEIYRVGSNTNPQSFQLTTGSRVPSANPLPPVEEDDLNTNVLKVKSSRNCTDLASERKLSSVKVINNTFAVPQNLRMPSSNGTVHTKVSSINFPTCSNLCDHNRNLNADFDRRYDAFLEKFENDITRSQLGGSVEPNRPQVNYSVTTFFHNPAPTASSTFSTSDHGETHNTKPSDMKLNK